MGVSVRVSRNTRVYLPWLVAIPLWVLTAAVWVVVAVVWVLVVLPVQYLKRRKQSA